MIRWQWLSWAWDSSIIFTNSTWSLRMVTVPVSPKLKSNSSCRTSIASRRHALGRIKRTWAELTKTITMSQTGITLRYSSPFQMSNTLTVKSVWSHMKIISITSIIALHIRNEQKFRMVPSLRSMYSSKSLIGNKSGSTIGRRNLSKRSTR